MLEKRSKKESRERQVLLGLVELYIESGRPIGSNTLREHGFEHLSSATIRNYFAQLENQGFLLQPHSSGGRIPTQEAFRLYAKEIQNSPQILPEVKANFQKIKSEETKNVALFLQRAAEQLSEVSGYAVFLSSVRFDHDFIHDIKLVGIDARRLLCVIITEFGQILNEVILTESKLSSFTLKRLESYFQWKLKRGDKPAALAVEEEAMAQAYYNEIMVRYLIRYSNFSDEDLHRTGFSRLLAYPEFNDPVALATGLSLFENTSHMRLLLNDCARSQTLRYWIGNELASYGSGSSDCSVIAVPHRIGQTITGSIGILGPCRMPYQTLFGTMQYFADCISEAMTKSLYTFKLSFRQPRSGAPYLEKQEKSMIGQPSQKLLEIKE